jgi:hypothetical protein
MVNFIVLNESEYEVDNINVIYADEHSMNDQHADADGVTVLSDSNIPNGTLVSEVNVGGVVVAEEPTIVPIGHGRTLIASLIYYTNPKSGQTEVIGVETQQEEES